MTKITVYVVKSKTNGTYYGSSAWRCGVELTDAKIFSKKGTATACANRMRDHEVLACELIVGEPV